MKVKMILTALCLMFSHQASMAGEFDSGSSEFDQPSKVYYDEAEIQRKIQEEMAIACSGNLCKIVGTDSHGSGWTVSFQIGYGNENNNGGDTIYIGGNGSNNNNGNNAYASVTVTYKNAQCTSNLRVTPAVYRFVNTYLYNMVNSDGSVKRNFSPADQTVILFYTTMLNKVSSCDHGAK